MIRPYKDYTIGVPDVQAIGSIRVGSFRSLLPEIDHLVGKGSSLLKEGPMTCTSLAMGKLLEI